MRSRISDHLSNLEEPIVRIDTATQRLDVSDKWVEFLIESDPFVVPTALGYAPAILIKRTGDQPREHLLVGAKSLAHPLEALRGSHKTLVGRTVRVRKEAPTRAAPYIVELRG